MLSKALNCYFFIFVVANSLLIFLNIPTFRRIGGIKVKAIQTAISNPKKQSINSKSIEDEINISIRVNIRTLS